MAAHFFRLMALKGEEKNQKKGPDKSTGIPFSVDDESLS